VSFESFSFDQRIAAGIAACGYETPTPIQSKTIPAILRGDDVLGLAQTGTGKTAAFALPILQHLINTDANRRGPVRALVLAPTRELALQIQETFIELGKQTGFRSACVFGGVGIVPQIKAMRSSSIAVACPGRLLDLAGRRECDLSNVDVLVLDEADRMFDMGFLPDLRRILALLPQQRQNLLFSATMPKEIRSLADSILRNPVTMQVNHTVPKSSITHVAYSVPMRQKTSLLEALLKQTDHESVLVFTRTKHRAKNVARILGEKGWKATSLQGNLSQNRRQEALEGFRAGKYTVMVATDIAARGIDCSSISHVINYDVPDTAETYTHRIGRTGRADRTGTAMTLVAGEDNSLMRTIERTLGSPVERLKLEGFVCDESQEQDQDFGRPPRAPFGSRRGGGKTSGRRSEDARGSRQGFSRSERMDANFGDRPSAPAATKRSESGERSANRSDNRSDNGRGYRGGRSEEGSRDFGRSMDRQRGGIRSPYADQLSDAPRYDRAAKPAFGGAKAAKSHRADDDGARRYDRKDRDGRGERSGNRFDGPARGERAERAGRFGGRDDRGGFAGRSERGNFGGRDERGGHGNRDEFRGGQSRAENGRGDNRGNSRRGGQSADAGKTSYRGRSEGGFNADNRRREDGRTDNRSGNRSGNRSRKPSGNGGNGGRSGAGYR